MKIRTVGFIGLGSMGKPMALNLLQAGFDLVVWGRTPSKLQDLVDAGAIMANSPADLARQCAICMLCLSDTDAVDQVVFGPEGIASGAQKGSVLVDHSSIHPHKTVEFAERVRALVGMNWLDAPVSGGVKGAEAGNLTVMCGGSEESLEKSRAAIESFAKRITLLGPVGSGQIAKSCNQLIIGATIQAIAEAMTMARNAGLNPEFLPDALTDGWADSKILQNHGRKMATMIAEPQTSAQSMAVASGLMVKDLDIASDMSKQTATPMPLTALVAQLYRMLAVSGLPQDGQIGLLHLLDKRR